ncbi:MAG: hypothetical protein QM656_09950 [Paracoccaceae bacterium]
MIELAFIACLAAEPSACEKKSLTYAEISPMTCMIGAQPMLAEWAQSHPKWHVARWTCRMRLGGGKDI